MRGPVTALPRGPDFHSVALLVLPSFVIVKCPTAAQKDVVIEAIRKGDISWHAGPMNLEIEMAEPWLFEFSLDLSMQLDKMFNITRSGRVLSQRDVPGGPYCSCLLTQIQAETNIPLVHFSRHIYAFRNEPAKVWNIEIFKTNFKIPTSKILFLT